MRKIEILLIVLLSLTVSALKAQWQPNGVTTGNIYYNNGNVGIGTASPIFKLHVVTSGNLQGLQLNNSGQNWLTMFSPSMTASAFNGITGTGDAGIIFGGTSTPASAASFGFVIAPHYNATSGLRVDPYGNVGINTASPISEFQVNDLGQRISFGKVPQQYRQSLNWATQYIGFNLSRGTTGWSSYTDGVNNGSSMIMADLFGQLRIVTVSSTGNSNRNMTESDINQSTKFIINSAGNVGIGTVSPDAMLAVKGTIHTNEVKVDLLGAVAPDYVFENSYNLPTLEELNAYIKVNKHLPEIPSACAMEENGINLGEMNMLLLKKVEELTLYMIDLKKENEAQQREIDLLKSSVNK